MTIKENRWTDRKAINNRVPPTFVYGGGGPNKLQKLKQKNDFSFFFFRLTNKVLFFNSKIQQVNNCWHFEIHYLKKFHALLSCA